MTTASWPPGRGTLSVPLDDRRTAAAALALDGPSRLVPLLVTAAAWAATRTLGTWVLRPFRAGPTAVDGPFEAVLDQLRVDLGAFDAVGVHRPRQDGRMHRAVLLVRGGLPIAFVKVRASEVGGAGIEGLGNEQVALESVARLGGGLLAGVAVPRPLGGGDVAGTGLAWGACTALPARPHRPVLDVELGALATAISGGLAGLPKPAGTPAGWLPCHGDLTPWNLRAVVGAGRWLFDWERACWAPPHADLVLAAAARGGLGRPIVAVGGGGEAAAWWREHLPTPAAGDDMANRIDDGLRVLTSS